MRRDTLEALIVDLGKMPRELQRELRPAMRRAAEPIQRDAQARAAWSTRIPSAIKIRPSLAQRNPGVRMVTDARKAPHARPYEGAASPRGVFRHRVFGHDRWVTARTRPFFFPAARAGSARAVEESAAAVTAAARAAGFR